MCGRSAMATRSAGCRPCSRREQCWWFCWLQRWPSSRTAFCLWSGASLFWCWAWEFRGAGQPVSKHSNAADVAAGRRPSASVLNVAPLPNPSGLARRPKDRVHGVRGRGVRVRREPAFRAARRRRRVGAGNGDGPRGRFGQRQDDARPLDPSLLGSRFRVGAHERNGASPDASGEVLSRVAVVFQDSMLLRASIADNIRLGRPGATDEQVQAAARQARFTIA